jgi:DNA-binding beta-propeller fold protein YncE
MTSRAANLRHTRRDFLRQAGLVGLALAGTETLGTGLAAAAPRAAGVAKRYEYVFTDGKATVFDMSHGLQKVAVVSLGAETTRIQGVAFAPPTGRLFVTYAASPAHPPNHGFVLCYDLVRHKVVWREPSPSGTGANSAEVTPDGRLLFVPAASNQTADPTWHVLDTATGSEVGAITGVGGRPHDTVVGLDGSKVYMGAISLNYLTVGDTATDAILRRVGPFGVGGPAGGGGVKPFTVNGKLTRAFVNVNGLLGFEVGDLTTGRSLFRIDLRDSGFPWTVTAKGPSHGISLSPDETEVWVNDQPNNRVHVFDVRGVTASPPTAPALRASIRLLGTLKGKTNQGDAREGWLQHSLDGRYVFVGDAGDVISTSTRKTVKRLPPLSNSKFHLEIDWDAQGRPVATSTRIGLGHVT